MSRRGTLIFLCVSLCFRPPVSLPADVSASLCFRQPASTPACTPASLYHQHCSTPSLISPIFIPLIRLCLIFSLVPFFPFSLIFSFLFFSDIFSSPSYFPDPSCSSRDTPFSAENLVSRTDFRTLGSFWQLFLQRHTFFCQKPCIANMFCEIAMCPLQRHTLLI